MRTTLSTALFAMGITATKPQQDRHGDPKAPIRSVQDLDLPRYAGLWYALAHYPNRFERNCYATTATYTLNPDGSVTVENRCRKGSLNGPEDGVTGKAVVAGPGQLKVGFVKYLPFIRGDYWVLEVTPDYHLAVVGEPGRKYGWVLSRAPHPSAELMEHAEAVLKRNGYNPALLERVVQP